MSKTVYVISATFSGKFKTVKAANAAAQKLKANSRAVVRTKKLASGYSVSVSYKFITPSASVRDKALTGARAKGAKVSVVTKKV